MIDLTGKSVFVRTQEEYSKVLRIAKLQGFRWARGKHLNAIDIPLPNMLNFHDERIVTYSSDERKMYEAYVVAERTIFPICFLRVALAIITNQL